MQTTDNGSYLEIDDRPAVRFERVYDHPVTRVWEAMGLASVRLEQAPADALDVLRAHALATGRVVEDVADDVVSGRLDARRLDPAADAL